VRSTLRRRGDLLLWRLRRRPLVWWTLAAVAASLSFLSVQSSIEAAAQQCPSTSEGHPPTVEATGGALARTLGPDLRAVAVPSAGLLPLEVGDVVDLVAPTAATVEGDAASATAQTVVEAVPVVAVADEAVTVAVDASDAPAVALAASQGGTTLTLVGTG